MILLRGSAAMTSEVAGTTSSVVPVIFATVARCGTSGVKRRAQKLGQRSLASR